MYITPRTCTRCKFLFTPTFFCFFALINRFYVNADIGLCNHKSNVAITFRIMTNHLSTTIENAPLMTLTYIIIPLPSPSGIFKKLIASKYRYVIIQKSFIELRNAPSIGLFDINEEKNSSSELLRAHNHHRNCRTHTFVSF